MLMVYEYGGLQPTAGQKEIDEQIYLAHQYYNDVATIEHERRELSIKAQLAFPEIAAAKKEYDAANTVLQALLKQKKQAKSHDKKTVAPPPEDIKEARKVRMDALQKLSAAKAEKKEQLTPTYDKLESEWLEKKKKIRNKSGLYWGNYQIIDDAIAAAKKATLSISDINKKKKPHEKIGVEDWVKMPRRRKWTGRGAVGVQIQSGLCLDDVWGSNTQLRIDPLPENAFDKSVPRGKRNKLQRTHVHLRVCSNGVKPVWGTWPIFLHREFPKDAIIKKAKVLRIPWKQGWKYQWKLQITLDIPEPTIKPGRTMVAINAGWRKMDDDELRVATWVDDQGKTGEVRLDSSFRQRIEKAEEIRGHRDKDLDKLRAFLMEQDLEDVNCSKWKSHKRFHELIKKQGENFPPNVMQTLSEWYEWQKNPEPAPPVLVSWADRDKHLWWYERGCRTGALNYRREIYRLFALKMAKRYDIIVIDDFNIKKIAEDEDRIKEPSAQRVEGAPSVLKSTLQSTGNRLGCYVIDGKSKLATQECHLCGCLEPWDAAPEVMHTCVACEKEWDQDVNNAKNLLSRAKKQIEAKGLPPKKNKKYVGRFHKAKKKNKGPGPVV